MQKLWTAFKSDLVEARRVSTEQKKKKEGGGAKAHWLIFIFLSGYRSSHEDNISCKLTSDFLNFLL